MTGENGRIPWTGHGKYKEKLYGVYMNMKQRCFNPKHPSYKHYGGRGITICDEWLNRHGFEHFYEWSNKNGYAVGLSIDRINNDGNYSPENCRWADRFTQNNNFSRNQNITFNGETHSLSEWGRLNPNGLSYNTLRSRLRAGWTVDEAFTRPKTTFDDDAGEMITIDGETHNVTHWCEIKGIAKSTYYRRVKRGWTKEKAVTGK